MSSVEDPKGELINSIRELAEDSNISVPSSLAQYSQQGLSQLQEALECIYANKPFAVTQDGPTTRLSRIYEHGYIMARPNVFIGWSGRGYFLETRRRVDNLDHVQWVNAGPGKTIDFLCFGEPMSPFQPQVVFTTEQVPSPTESLTVQYRSDDSGEFDLLVLSMNLGKLTGHGGTDSGGDDLRLDPETSFATYEYDSGKEQLGRIEINSGDFHALVLGNERTSSVALKIDIRSTDDIYHVTIYVRERNKTDPEYQYDISTITMDVPKTMAFPDGFTLTPFADASNPTNEEAQALDSVLAEMWSRNISTCKYKTDSF